MSISDVDSHPHEQLRYQVYKYIRALPQAEVSMDEIRHCVVHEHTLLPLLPVEFLAEIDANDDSVITSVEWRNFDFPDMNEDSDEWNYEEIEAGAIYIRCRGKNWLLDMLS